MLKEFHFDLFSAVKLSLGMSPAQTIKLFTLLLAEKIQRHAVALPCENPRTFN